MRGIYAFFFAAVLPLLCWGGIADPHHPHWQAHFALVEPPAVETLAAPWHEHEPCLHPSGAHPPAPKLAATETSSEPTGQAVPTTVMAELVVLVLWAVVTLCRPPAARFVTYLQLPGSGGSTARVPTPPPRLLLV